ncbi:GLYCOSYLTRANSFERASE [Salix koriyanagi]|uniref:GLYCOSYLTRANSFERASE n=1 Tax=Salix koriyanagi TaxID=2511006 RepID=A0A9Q0WEL1_9ROSI|nr:GLYCOSYLTRANSFERASE [Salix koriyanagi]
MASQSHQLHFVLFPLIAQGHLIPMFDTARMLARHGVIVTIVTTQLNAKRFAIPLARAAEAGLQIRAVEIQFSCQETGLPNEIENFDMLPSLGLGYELFMAANTLQEPVERLFEGLTPRPSCIISDMCLPYTSNVATKFGIPRISFNGFSCFCTLCLHNIQIYEALESVSSESELFVVPGLPDHIELASNHLPSAMIDVKDFSALVSDAEMLSVGSQVTLKWGEEEKFGVLVKKEQVKNAVNSVMNVGEESEERRRRARELGKMANKAVEEEGSSYLSMKLLIEDIRKKTFVEKKGETL